jgi:hypothetical protein
MVCVCVCVCVCARARACVCVCVCVCRARASRVVLARTGESLGTVSTPRGLACVTGIRLSRSVMISFLCPAYLLCLFVHAFEAFKHT